MTKNNILKIVAVTIILLILSISVLRAVGVLDGDPIIPLILLIIMFIAGYLYNMINLLSAYIVIRYNEISAKEKSTENMPQWISWN